MPSINIPLLSIPLYYILAVYPHGRAILISTRGNIQTHDNRNPKSSTLASSIQKRLSPSEFAAWERAESCHRNHLENMPLFVAAIFAGILAERETGRDLGTSSFALAWLATRVAYTVNYLRTESMKWTYLRSALYFLGTGLCFATIGRAALVLA